MNSNFFDFDLDEPVLVVSFGSFRQGEILKHLLQDAAVNWLTTHFHGQLMRFGLMVEMGELEVEIDESLKRTDRLQAFARAWVKSLSSKWPLDADFHGIPLNPLLKPVLLKSLRGMSAVDAVFEDLDCIVKHLSLIHI